MLRFRHAKWANDVLIQYSRIGPTLLYKRLFATRQFPILDAQLPGPCKTLHVTVDRPAPALQIIADALPDRSIAFAEELVAFGAVYHKAVSSEKLMRPKRMLSVHTAAATGDYFRIHTAPRRFPAARSRKSNEWRALVIADEVDYIVVNKPPGVPVHASVDNAHENLTKCMVDALGLSKLWAPHRLDIDTHGLVTLCKTRQFAADFQNIMRGGPECIRKLYRATVHCKQSPIQKLLASGAGHPVDVADPSPTVELLHWQQIDGRAPKIFTESMPTGDEVVSGWRDCKLRVVHEVQSGEHLWNLTIELLTGRTHQIRGQLHLAGLPIKGDRMYCAERRLDEGNTMRESPQLCLQAHHLAFKLPQKTEWRSYSLDDCRSTISTGGDDDP
eukprot:CAMPEP_0118936298 /NCGR_PEP_ID=MMETSP1169-20130426/17866_1 /TAXON_ID=36882 /ORGANISM="Pyramimonas obovata, Strain CCMP722" /LENGTH=386 /DNA_ID=CAMNT_0006879491 /DNA_START=162 /DNA_END=1319 /DNA_ORIENTATION=-